MNRSSIVLLVVAFPLACKDPVRPMLCEDPPSVKAVLNYPVERRVCVQSGNPDALTYTAVSSSPEIVTVASSGRHLTITAQKEGSAEITVTVTDAGTTIGTVVYPVSVVEPWWGRIETCDAEYDSDEDATELTIAASVTANIGLTDVIVLFYYGGDLAGASYVGDLEANRTVRIFSSPRGTGDQTGGDCELDVEYEIVG